MDGFGKTLYWFSEENLIIDVPFFQRPYVWNYDNWQSMKESIEASDDKKMPFLGSFILQQKRENEKNYWIIDGQQRITTLSILIRAFLDQKKFLVIPHVRSKLEEMIYKTELIDGEHVSYNCRLIPSNADADSYEKVMAIDNNKQISEGKSKIEDCYLFFQKFIDELNEESFKKLTNKLITTSKYIIVITLDSNDDEQKIFDTVNSLGRRLTNSDIIKNYLYQKMKSFAHGEKCFENEVLSHYKKYWQKVFLNDETSEFWDKSISLGRITTTNLDAFLKDYGTIKEIYAPSESGGFDGLAKEYKKHIDTLSEEELKAFSIELSEYAHCYYKLWKDYYECNDFRITDKLNSTLLILDKLETSTFNSYVLKLVKENDNEIGEKLYHLQRFLLRRFLWKASTKNYNKCCLEVLKSDNPNKYLDDYNEQSNVEWDEYPQQIKNLRNGQGTLLLFLIEMIRRNTYGEDKYSDTLIYNKSLEHIMPQKWEVHWYSVPSFKLDENGGYIEVTDDEKTKNRRLKISSLGNMAILNSKLNSSISNDEFSIKIDGKLNKKGIRHFVGTISVTNEIVLSYDSNPKWDERDIIERELSLFNELNDFYKFGKKFELALEENIDVNKELNISYFSDEYFNNTKVGIIAREAFAFLIKNNLLTDEEITLLQTKEYSSKNFGVWLPIFELNPSKVYDEKKHRRYYKDILSKEPPIYLCKEWIERRKDRLLDWVKPRISRYNSYFSG